jgi:hypothetical protein
MVMEAVGSAATAVGEALGLIKPEKAKLACVGKNLPDENDPIECMFNPTEYELRQTMTVTRNRAPSRPAGTPEFGGTNAMTLTLKLFFDEFSLADGDVTPRITRLLSWTKPTKKSVDEGNPCPPLVAFQWGNNPQLANFQGFLKTVAVTYKLFRRDGTPVRADVTVTLEGETEQFGATNPTSHATESRRIHVLLEGESLQSVAYGEFGRAAYWRAIAELNGIDDPVRVRPGTRLVIPTLADAARGS